MGWWFKTHQNKRSNRISAIYIAIIWYIFPLGGIFYSFFSLHTKTLRHFNEWLKGIDLENIFRNVLWKNNFYFYFLFLKKVV